MKIINEFKEFAMKGNVIDLAIGVIIGGAFGKIVTSLVNDILMPPLGVLLGNMKFTAMKIVLIDAVKDGEKIIKEPVTLNYGNFIQVSIDFLLVASAIFLAIKAINKFKRKEEAAPAAPAPTPEPSEDIKLLTEIRDLLRK